MNWKYVLNGNFRLGTHIDDVFTAAVVTGYRFFIFNGIIWFIHKDKKNYEDTGLTIKDMI